ncbi:hypothetical protein HDU76_005995 [Blyttiomyces sp. JEL0837]|nr:hypothetical protein HDU76_005995 [Blyttiomyces sp. JEL0837]
MLSANDDGLSRKDVAKLSELDHGKTKSPRKGGRFPNPDKDEMYSVNGHFRLDEKEKEDVMENQSKKKEQQKEQQKMGRTNEKDSHNVSRRRVIMSDDDVTEVLDGPEAESKPVFSVPDDDTQADVNEVLNAIKSDLERETSSAYGAESETSPAKVNGSIKKTRGLNPGSVDVSESENEKDTSGRQPSLPKDLQKRGKVVSHEPTTRSKKRRRARQDDDGDSDVVAVRRTSRNHIKPLEYWRNERVLYSYTKNETGEVVVPQAVEVIRGPREDELKPKKQKANTESGGHGRRRSYNRSRGLESQDDDELDKSLEPKSKSVLVIDSETNEEREMEIVCTPSMINPDIACQGNFVLQRTLKAGEHCGTGILDLPVGAEKPTKNSGTTAVVFYVIYGKVRISIHNSTFVLGKDSHFIVPPGNLYKLVNEFARDARLLFVQAREITHGNEQA